MAADSAGNDLSKVFVPVTGYAALAPFGTAFPSSAEGANPVLVLDPLFKKFGLLKVDGGPGWTMEKSGDAIEFWQDGYSIPSGLANVACAVTAAEQNDWVREIKSGMTPDANGFLIYDGGGHDTQYVLFTEEIDKHENIRRRVAANVQVDTVTEDKSTRGEVLGDQITLKVNRSPLLSNGHFGEWFITAAGGGS